MGLFGRKKNGAGERGRTRIFFCTDVHGSTVCFKKFVNAARFYDADVLILGGDVTGKMVVPIAHQPDGTYLTSFAGEELRFSGEDFSEFFSEIEVTVRGEPGEDRPNPLATREHRVSHRPVEPLRPCRLLGEQPPQRGLHHRPLGREQLGGVHQPSTSSGSVERLLSMPPL